MELFPARVNIREAGCKGRMAKIVERRGEAEGTTHLGKRPSQESLEKRSNASLHDFVRIGRREGRVKPNIDTDTHPSL